MLSIEKQIELLRGNDTSKTLIDTTKNIEFNEIEDAISEGDREVYIELKDDLAVGTIGGGFKATGSIIELKGKTLKVERIIKRNRTEEDAKRGGRAGLIYGFYCAYIDNNGNVVSSTGGAIDMDFLKQKTVITFKDKPFEERMDDINKILIANTDDGKDKLEDLKRRYSSKEREVIDIKSKLVVELKRYKSLNAEILALEKQDNKIDYKSDLQMLVDNKYFRDLRIDKDVDGRKAFIFETNYINIVDPRNLENVFQGNRFEISVALENGRIRFKGLDRDKCHKSYWTDNDPHPHVDGRRGEACLGNVSSTFAELISSNEIYALFTVLVNFLQTFNIEDVAGKNIKNWKMLDGSKNPYKEESSCSICDCDIDLDDDDYHRCPICGRLVCDTHSRWHDIRDGYLCESCYEDVTHTCNDCEETFEEDTTKCEVCGVDLCRGCKIWSEQRQAYVCSEHKDVVPVTPSVPEEPIPTPTVVNCRDCGKGLASDEIISWIGEEGNVIEICTDCMKNREGRL